MTTRRAVPGDAGALDQIAAEAYAVYLERMSGRRPGPMDTDYRQAIIDKDVWVVECDGVVAGYVVLAVRSDHLLLENVAVGPGWQGRGIGRRLMALAEDRARAVGVDVVRLYTHEVMVENQRLYERLGYAETGRRTDDGFARVFYEKRLPENGSDVG